jgi:hypothetical protein
VPTVVAVQESEFHPSLSQQVRLLSQLRDALISLSEEEKRLREPAFQPNISSSSPRDATVVGERHKQLATQRKRCLRAALGYFFLLYCQYLTTCGMNKQEESAPLRPLFASWEIPFLGDSADILQVR